MEEKSFLHEWELRFRELVREDEAAVRRDRAQDATIRIYAADRIADAVLSGLLVVDRSKFSSDQTMQGFCKWLDDMLEAYDKGLGGCDDY